MVISRKSYDSQARYDLGGPDLMSLEEYGARVGEGMTKVREQARLDRLLCPVLRSGRRYFVSRRAFEEVLRRQHGDSALAS